MATYYYDAQATGANDGSSLADAFTTYAAFVAALNADGDVGYHVAESQESLSTSTTFTFQASVSVYCVDRATGATITDPNDVSGYVGDGAHVTVTALSGKAVFMSHFRTLLTVVGSQRHLTIGTSTSGAAIFIGKLWVESASSTNYIYFGASNIYAENYVHIGQFTWNRGAANDKIIGQGAKVKIDKLVLSGTTTENGGILTTERAGCTIEINGFESSLASGSTLVGNCISSPGTVKFTNSTFPDSYVLLATQTSGVPSSGEVFAYDCQVGSTAIPFEYANAFGNIKSDTGKFANDNLSGNRSYLVTTTAKVRPDTPFITPWIEQYHAATSAISPYFAIARDGSATAFDDDEVWAELDAKVTASSVIKTRYSDAMALLGTPAAQTTDSTTSWTGLGGANWKGKVGEQSLTPAEPGTLSGRLVVGLANASFNWDTRIRF